MTNDQAADLVPHLRTMLADCREVSERRAQVLSMVRFELGRMLAGNDFRSAVARLHASSIVTRIREELGETT